MNKCVLCNWSAELKRLPDEILECSCPNCGNYQIERDILEDLPAEIARDLKGVKYIAAGTIREMNESSPNLERITKDNYENLFKNPHAPKRTMEKLYKVLLYIYKRTEHFNHNLNLESLGLTPAIAYAKNNEELRAFFASLSYLGYLELTSTSVTVTLNGMEKAESLLSERSASDQCFVAMWFGEEIKKVYEKYIARAILDAGYKPVMIALEEYNDDICDQIMAEIKQSRFIVADFTGHRGGVYFEAGFAYGLGLPVIWTCRKDWFNAEATRIVTTKDGKSVDIIENRQIHFDIEHFNFIIWETGQELYEKINKRILATI